ncbi:hypothetical protein B0H14DRAFT_2390670, partial [Mycena olivaceomarginata]
VGCYRDLPSWRKDFKSEWNVARDTKITLPLNPKYRPNPQKWTCTCPKFHKSRFLICKHLVQAVHPVDPVFFLEVQRNRTTPFWAHPSLKPLHPISVSAPLNAPAESVMQQADMIDDEDSDDNIEDLSHSDIELPDVNDTGCGTFDERLTTALETMRNFCDELEYQRQFQDTRMLDALERDGASFFRLAHNCLSHEHRQNSTQGVGPKTWERSTANAMFYRSRPALRDRVGTLEGLWN